MGITREQLIDLVYMTMPPGYGNTKKHERKDLPTDLYCPFCGEQNVTVCISHYDGVPCFDGGDYYEGYTYNCHSCKDRFTLPKYEPLEDD